LSLALIKSRIEDIVVLANLGPSGKWQLNWRKSIHHHFSTSSTLSKAVFTTAVASFLIFHPFQKY